jgi:CxxC motif-containing protein
MKDYTCIVCPNGCSLHYDETANICTGNRCPRGAKYAESEFKNPMRSLTSTVRTTLPEYPVISVRTSQEVPKKLIPLVMKEINKIVIKDYLPINSVVLANVLSTGASIITTAPMMKKGK